MRENMDRIGVAPSLSRAPKNKLVLALTALFSAMTAACLSSDDKNPNPYDLSSLYKTDETAEANYFEYHSKKLKELEEKTKTEDEKAYKEEIEHYELPSKILGMELKKFDELSRKLKPLLKLLRNNRWIYQTSGGIKTKKTNFDCSEEEIERVQEVKAILDDKHDIRLIRKGWDSAGIETSAMGSTLSIIIQDKSGKPLLEFNYSWSSGSYYKSLCAITDHTEIASINPTTNESEPVTYLFNYTNNFPDGPYYPNMPTASPEIERLIESTGHRWDFDGEPSEHIDALRIKNLDVNLPPEIGELMILLGIERSRY